MLEIYLLIRNNKILRIHSSVWKDTRRNRTDDKINHDRIVL